MGELMKKSLTVPCRVAWAMPSRWTFEIPPIAAFVRRWTRRPGLVIVDPFAGKSLVGTHRNDLANKGIDAGDYCQRLLHDGVEADVVIFDPPYSPRQISECYKGLGRTVTTKDTQNAALYARVRRPLSALLRPGGIALCFGWQSSGLSSKWRIEDMLLVRHGGAHNDTICVAQRKPEADDA